jgi:hypothetical protein
MSAGARLRSEQGTDTEQILLLSELSAASNANFHRSRESWREVDPSAAQASLSTFIHQQYSLPAQKKCAVVFNLLEYVWPTGNCRAHHDKR